MRKLNKSAERTFRACLPDGPSHKIDNSGGTFMPLSVDRLFPTTIGQVVSLAHYYEQNGDLVADPDMTFLVSPHGVFPLTFQQGGLYQEAVVWDGPKVRGVRQKLQSQLTTFANGWLRNIREQQRIGRAVPA